MLEIISSLGDSFAVSLFRLLPTSARKSAHTLVQLMVHRLHGVVNSIDCLASSPGTQYLV